MWERVRILGDKFIVEGGAGGSIDRHIVVGLVKAEHGKILSAEVEMLH